MLEPIRIRPRFSLADSQPILFSDTKADSQTVQFSETQQKELNRLLRQAEKHGIWDLERDDLPTSEDSVYNRKRRRLYRQTHKEKIKEEKKRWHDRHREQINAYQREYYKRRKLALPQNTRKD